jgi:hypothetical protein
VKKFSLACIALLLTLVTASGAWAGTCKPQTAEQAWHGAEVVIEATTIEVVAEPAGTGGADRVARFRVDRYRKGTGAGEVKVRTGQHRDATGDETIVFGGLNPQPGERWVLYGDWEAQRLVRSSVCDGSHLASERGMFVRGPGAWLTDQIRYRWPWLLAAGIVVPGAVLFTRRRGLMPARLPRRVR